ncbi:MAG: hypothetical protein HND47_19995 [Chloroflexi bacterium]|nr:hypothetical protein [Chloroflexota bacterium]
MTTNVGSTTTYFVGAYYEMTGSSITKYYFAGSQRIAMRKDGVLYYILGDHLGSTSIVTDASGNVVSQTRYKAWGEVRYSSGTSPTDYTFTGQKSYSDSFGLMYYNARWYDPYLNHMTQPDSIVPDPYNPLDWNRYSYARYNPLRYTDPSGHVPCTDDGYCGYLSDVAYQKHIYSNAIKDVYDWNLEGNWTLEELQTIYQTGRDIEAYVDGLTGGKGQEWMNAYLGGTTITHWSSKGAMALPDWLVGTNTIYLGRQNFDSQIFAHELGHIWDINTSSYGPCVCGVVGGVADELNAVIGGSAFFRAPSIRWMNDNNSSPIFTIPETVTYGNVTFYNWFSGKLGTYGNNSTADYLAESFSWNIYDHDNVPVLARAWVDTMIAVQANALP